MLALLRFSFSKLFFTWENLVQAVCLIDASNIHVVKDRKNHITWIVCSWVQLVGPIHLVASYWYWKGLETKMILGLHKWSLVEVQFPITMNHFSAGVAYLQSPGWIHSTKRLDLVWDLTQPAMVCRIRQHAAAASQQSPLQHPPQQSSLMFSCVPT